MLSTQGTINIARKASDRCRRLTNGWAARMVGLLFVFLAWRGPVRNVTRVARKKAKKAEQEIDSLVIKYMPG